jgi:hypothetical protein
MKPEPSGRCDRPRKPDDGLPTGRTAPATGGTAGTSNAAALAQATTGAHLASTSRNRERAKAAGRIT